MARKWNKGNGLLYNKVLRSMSFIASLSALISSSGIINTLVLYSALISSSGTINTLVLYLEKLHVVPKEHFVSKQFLLLNW